MITVKMRTIDSMSLAVHMTQADVPGRCRQSEPHGRWEKCLFPSIDYVSVLHLKDWTTWLPVTANLAINSLRAEFTVA